MNLRIASAVAAVSLPMILLGSRCAPTTSHDVAALRFSLDASGSGPSPLYVQVATAGDQPGWIRVTHADGRPVYLKPRCEIADCGKPAAVCGAAIPLVRDISSIGRVEFAWDGTDSVLDSAAGCEIRQPATPGNYVASFCYSRKAETTGDGNPASGIQGSLVTPVCRDVLFTWPKATDVKYRIPDRNDE